MRAWLAALIVLISWQAHAFDPVTIAIIPDTQNAVWCTADAPAWETGFASFTWLQAQASYVNYGIQVGDVVQKKALDISASDCGCAGTVDADSDGCADIVNPRDSSVTCTACDVPCTGGDAGYLCEWTRAETLADEVPDIAIIWNDGNHDYDRGAFSPTNENNFTLFRNYISDRPQPSSIDAGGSKQFFNSPNNATSPVQWHVFTASGAQWLSFAIPIAPWHRNAYPGEKDNQTAIVEYVLEIIDRFPGMPTIISAHLMVSSDDIVGYHPSSRDCGFCEDQAGDDWTGKTMFNQVASVRPQVVMMVGGHDRDLRQIVTTTDNGDRVLGVLVDYSFGFDDSLPGIVGGSYLDSNNAAAVAGGGAIVMLSIDLVAGRIWAWSKIAHADATDGTTATDGRDMRTGLNAAYWTVQMPFCQDPDRFNLPAAACPDTTPAVVAR